MKFFSLIFIFSYYLYANINPIALQYSGVKVTHTFLDGSKKEYTIQREVHKDCLKMPVNPENFDEQNIRNNISNRCKREFIITTGVIQPMIFDEKIKTIGEIEVLDFIYNKAQKEPNKYALIDSRKAIWFKKQTIPSALSVPFEDLAYDEDFIEDFNKAYENLGVKVIGKNQFDFTNAKTVVFFCNGVWCPISSKSMNYLIKLGYPKEKMLWYRGGMTSWNFVSLTTTKK
jgi:rhodanese-related sulfurtransferase